MTKHEIEDPCCQRVVSTVVGLLLVVGLVFFVKSLVHTGYGSNKLPNMLIVTPGSVTGFNLTTTELSATWNLTLLARNPSVDFTIDFDVTKVLVYYGKSDYVEYRNEEYYTLASIQLPPFSVAAGNETHLNVQLGVVRAALGYLPENALAAQEIQANNGSSVKFGLYMDISWTFRTKSPEVRGSDDTGGVKTFICDPMELFLSPNTSSSHLGVGIFRGPPIFC